MPLALGLGLGIDPGNFKIMPALFICELKTYLRFCPWWLPTKRSAGEIELAIEIIDVRENAR